MHETSPDPPPPAGVPVEWDELQLQLTMAGLLNLKAHIEAVLRNGLRPHGAQALLATQWLGAIAQVERKLRAAPAFPAAAFDGGDHARS